MAWPLFCFYNTTCPRWTRDYGDQVECWHWDSMYFLSFCSSYILFFSMETIPWEIRAAPPPPPPPTSAPPPLPAREDSQLRQSRASQPANSFLFSQLWKHVFRLLCRAVHVVPACTTEECTSKNKLDTQSHCIQTAAVGVCKYSLSKRSLVINPKGAWKYLVVFILKKTLLFFLSSLRRNCNPEGRSRSSDWEKIIIFFFFFYYFFAFSMYTWQQQNIFKKRR